MHLIFTKWGPTSNIERKHYYDHFYPMWHNFFFYKNIISILWLKMNNPFQINLYRIMHQKQTIITSYLLYISIFVLRKKIFSFRYIKSPEWLDTCFTWCIFECYHCYKMPIDVFKKYALSTHTLISVYK